MDKKKQQVKQKAQKVADWATKQVQDAAKPKKLPSARRVKK